ESPRCLDRSVLIDLVAGHDAAGLRTLLTQEPRELAGIDARDGDHLAALEKLRQGFVRTPAAGDEWQIADDETCRIHLRGLEVLGCGAGVADVRAGERDDLPRVGRVGENLFVSGEGGVENDFACGVALRSDRLAAEDRSIGQREHRRYAHVINSPSLTYTKREEFSRTSSRLAWTNPYTD